MCWYWSADRIGREETDSLGEREGCLGKSGPSDECAVGQWVQGMIAQVDGDPDPWEDTDQQPIEGLVLWSGGLDKLGKMTRSWTRRLRSGSRSWPILGPDLQEAPNVA